MAIDFVSQTSAYETIHQKLLRSYFVQLRRFQHVNPKPLNIEKAIQTLQSFETELIKGKGHDLVESPSVSLGTDVRITTDENTLHLLRRKEQQLQNLLERVQKLELR